LCYEFHLYPILFYGWLKDFFENGYAAFENGRKTEAVTDAKEKKIEQLQAKLQRKNEVTLLFALIAGPVEWALIDYLNEMGTPQKAYFLDGSSAGCARFFRHHTALISETQDRDIRGVAVRCF
jgi:hypothetical protein